MRIQRKFCILPGMKRFLPILLLALLLPGFSPLAAQSLLRRLSTAHGEFWTRAFGDSRWRERRIGIVVVKQRRMLHVVRQGARRDTVATFPVCAMPTTPGFKAREGDGRTPEGIYRIPLLNPSSSFHLSMKLDYPNAVDNARHARQSRLAGGRWSQGGDIYIHGDCASIGCIAMTDEVIEKLYLLVASLPAGRRQLRVLVLPFDTDAQYEQMYIHADTTYREHGDAYWLLLRDHMQNMRALWNYYMRTGRIPDAVAARDGTYVIPRDDGGGTAP